MNIAEARKQLGHFAAALKQYQQFLIETEVGPESDLYRQAEARAQELQSLVGNIKIVCNLDGARVMLDGAEAGMTPLDPIPVDAGTHKLLVESPGYDNFEQSVGVSAGETVEIEAKLALPMEKVSAQPELVAKAEPEEEESGGVTSKWWFWVATGVVVAAGVGVAVAATSGGDDFVPGGELGVTGLSEWQRF